MDEVLVLLSLILALCYIVMEAPSPECILAFFCVELCLVYLGLSDE